MRIDYRKHGTPKTITQTKPGTMGMTYQKIKTSGQRSYWYSKERIGNRIVTKYIGKHLPQRDLFNDD
jgi:hypothetical protein